MTEAINTNATATATARRLTRKAAIYRISVLEPRLAKFISYVEADRAELAALQEVLPTLPEVAEGVPGATYDVGNVINLTVGREAKRREVTGVVVGIATNAAGQPARYKVEVGTGFDAEFHTVYPGSITGVVGAPTQTEDEALDAVLDNEPEDNPAGAVGEGLYDVLDAASAFANAHGTEAF